MKKAAMAARVGNRILSIMAGILILLMLSYGVYSLWDTYKIYANSFADEELLKFRPTDDGEDNPTLKDLKKLNPDVKAWIQVPKTNIDYPVVQGQDDMEYINKNVYGEFELSGAIFLSCLNKDDFSDPYNLVYGHNMKNGGMFADVADFTNKEYFETHQKGKLYLTDATRKIQFFACMKVTAADAKIYHPDGYRKENLKDLLDYIQANAVQYRDVNVADENSLIALSTCSEAETNGRRRVGVDGSHVEAEPIVRSPHVLDPKFIDHAGAFHAPAVLGLLAGLAREDQFGHPRVEFGGNRVGESLCRILLGLVLQVVVLAQGHRRKNGDKHEDKNDLNQGEALLTFVREHVVDPCWKWNF